MLKYFINKICGKFIFAPRIMICIPSQVTEVEKKAVIDAASITAFFSTSVTFDGMQIIILGANINFPHTLFIKYLSIFSVTV